jgi:hypothetical protein
MWHQNAVFEEVGIKESHRCPMTELSKWLKFEEKFLTSDKEPKVAPKCGF